MTTNGERRDLLMDNTHWSREQIVDAVDAIRLNGYRTEVGSDDGSSSFRT